MRGSTSKMKTLGVSSVMVGVLGALVAGCVFAFGLDAAAQVSALIGVAVGTLFGFVALVVKGQEAPQRATAKVKHLLSTQVVSMLLRLAALLVGAFALKRAGLEPFAYVLAFFAVYLLQQLVELRFVLNRNLPSEVSSP